MNFDTWQEWLLLAVALSGAISTLSSRVRSFVTGVFSGIVYVVRLGRSFPVLMDIADEVRGDGNGHPSLREFIGAEIVPVREDLAEIKEALGIGSTDPTDHVIQP